MAGTPDDEQLDKMVREEAAAPPSSAMELLMARTFLRLSGSQDREQVALIHAVMAVAEELAGIRTALERRLPRG